MAPSISLLLLQPSRNLENPLLFLIASPLSFSPIQGISPHHFSAVKMLQHFGYYQNCPRYARCRFIEQNSVSSLFDSHLSHGHCLPCPRYFHPWPAILRVLCIVHFEWTSVVWGKAHSADTCLQCLLLKTGKSILVMGTFSLHRENQTFLSRRFGFLSLRVKFLPIQVLNPNLYLSLRQVRDQ